MEYAKGKNLDVIIEKLPNGRFKQKEAVQIFK